MFFSRYGGKFGNALLVKPFYNRITRKLYKIFSIPVEEAHTKQFPICKYIDWDMIIDKDGNPFCIEINSCQNGHLIFQLSAGPTFAIELVRLLTIVKLRNYLSINHLLNIDVR